MLGVQVRKLNSHRIIMSRVGKLVLVRFIIKTRMEMVI